MFYNYFHFIKMKIQLNHKLLCVYVCQLSEHCTCSNFFCSYTCSVCGIFPVSVLFALDSVLQSIIFQISTSNLSTVNGETLAPSKIRKSTYKHL